MNDTALSQPIRYRYRIRFAKAGLLRWIGHRDLQRLWERMLRRCDVRLSMTEGFHARARINLPSALALGMEGLDEVAEIEITQPIPEEELRQRLIDDDQPGMSIGEVTFCATVDGSGVPPKVGKAKLHSSQVEIEIPEGFDLGRVDQAIEQAAGLGTITVDRKEKAITVDVREVIQDVRRCDAFICVTQIEVPGPSLKLSEWLDAIGLADLIPSGAILRRTRVFLIDELPTYESQLSDFESDAETYPLESKTS
jgi:radical SAM-linked protein